MEVEYDHDRAFSYLKTFASSLPVDDVDLTSGRFGDPFLDDNLSFTDVEQIVMARFMASVATALLGDAAASAAVAPVLSVEELRQVVTAAGVHESMIRDNAEAYARLSKPILVPAPPVVPAGANATGVYYVLNVLSAARTIATIGDRGRVRQILQAPPDIEGLPTFAELLEKQGLGTPEAVVLTPDFFTYMLKYYGTYFSTNKMYFSTLSVADWLKAATALTTLVGTVLGASNVVLASRVVSAITSRSTGPEAFQSTPELMKQVAECAEGKAVTQAYGDVVKQVAEYLHDKIQRRPMEDSKRAIDTVFKLGAVNGLRRRGSLPTLDETTRAVRKLLNVDSTTGNPKIFDALKGDLTPDNYRTLISDVVETSDVGAAQREALRIALEAKAWGKDQTQCIAEAAASSSPAVRAAATGWRHAPTVFVGIVGSVFFGALFGAVYDTYQMRVGARLACVEAYLQFLGVGVDVEAGEPSGFAAYVAETNTCIDRLIAEARQAQQAVSRQARGAARRVLADVPRLKQAINRQVGEITDKRRRYTREVRDKPQDEKNNKAYELFKYAQPRIEQIRAERDKLYEKIEKFAEGIDKDDIEGDLCEWLADRAGEDSEQDDAPDDGAGVGIAAVANEHIRVPAPKAVGRAAPRTRSSVDELCAAFLAARRVDGEGAFAAGAASGKSVTDATVDAFLALKLETRETARRDAATDGSVATRARAFAGGRE